MDDCAAIILAAGHGKRMKSALVKVLHPLAGVPLLNHVIALVKRLEIKPSFVVVGHQAEAVSKVVTERGLEAILQNPPLGTGHAVQQAKNALENHHGPVLILNGDTPLLKAETLRSFIETHRQTQASLSLLTVSLDHPTGYGRIVRGEDGGIQRIVEEKDASPAEREINEVNTGVYLIESDFLFHALDQIQCDNQQQEYYLTDVVGIATQEGRRLTGMKVDSDEVIGINSRADLVKAQKVIRNRINRHWLEEGVMLINPEQIYIDASVTIGRDTVLHPGVCLEGNTEVGEKTCLYPSRIRDSIIGDEVVVKDHCVIENAYIESKVSVGPFAHLRPGTILRKGSKVGNFVEIKKCELGEGSKANHLSYLGDAEIGKGVNIGAGTITCNYDGQKKSRTIIDDNVFVGSDTQLVAPVHIGADAMIAAGTTVTGEVPAGALAISRVKQENKAGWAKRFRSQSPKKTVPGSSLKSMKQGKPS